VGDAAPEVSVVVATFERENRLADLVASLRGQTLAAARFEVIVVDDGSRDGTAELLERERGGLTMRTIRRAENGGWALAREEGWRAAQAPIVAFTDDDCRPSPDWLAAGLDACVANPGSIVQGRTEPAWEEWHRLNRFERPFTQTIEVDSPDPHFQTCNVFYPREVLERVGGFDTDAFARIPGEDADLAWRAIATGVPTAFAPDALVRHGFNRLGPLGKLRRAAGWDLRVYAAHPGLRRAWFQRRVFWKGSHYLLVRALIAAALPRRLAPVRAWLGLPYAVHLVERGRAEGGGPLLGPYFLVHDLIELAASVRSAVRYRVPML
jgi:GT2 family glycosyltransferase